MTILQDTSRVSEMPPVARTVPEPATDALTVETPPDLQQSPHELLHAGQTSAKKRLTALIESTDPILLERYFGEEQNDAKKSEVTRRIGSFMVKMSRDPEMRGLLHIVIVDDEESWDDTAIDKAHSKVRDLMNMEKNAQAAYRAHGDRLPTTIWHCCRHHCLATIAMDPQQMLLLDELILSMTTPIAVM